MNCLSSDTNMGLSHDRVNVPHRMGEYLDPLPPAVLNRRARMRQILITGSALSALTVSIIAILIA